MSETAKIPEEMQGAIDRALQKLKDRLGVNLHSCILYGSAARGDAVAGSSDVNLLLILEESTPEAHAAVAESIQDSVPIEPFIIGRSGMERSFSAFAIKFRSIQRDYRVLHGKDPFVQLELDPKIVHFLCEQALRNLRLRSVRAFVKTYRNPKQYGIYLHHVTPKLFVHVSEALRWAEVDVPHQFSDRIALIQREMGVDSGILKDLIQLKLQPKTLTTGEIAEYHRRLFRFLNDSVAWLESRWPEA